MGQAKHRAAEINELKKSPKPARMGRIELRAEMQQQLVKVLVTGLASALSPTGRLTKSQPELQDLPANSPESD